MSLRFGDLRDGVILVLATSGIVHQEFVGPVNTALLLLYGSMLGLPAFLPDGLIDRVRDGGNGK